MPSICYLCVYPLVFPSALCCILDPLTQSYRGSIRFSLWLLAGRGGKAASSAAAAASSEEKRYPMDAPPPIHLQQKNASGQMHSTAVTRLMYSGEWGVWPA